MGHYRIGLMAVHAAIDYPRSLRLGVKNTLEEAGHTLVTIAELIPYHTLENAEAYYKVACQVAARLDLDAIIYPAGCVAAYMHGNTKKSLELLHILNPENTLVLERDVDGYRCVTKDNAPGMHACMKHLIEDCGFTKIGFVSGPEGSRGAREREAVYFEEMEAHGIHPDPSLFVRGDFAGHCADEIRQLIDGNPGIEAIACACDLIAYTTYSVLHELGLVVGQDVAVTGFDDNPRSAHMDPPLSTVHITSYDYGCMAAREAIRICEGKAQEEHVLSSTFIARGSCGENVRNGVEYFRELLREKPFPVDKFVSIMLDSTLTMASSRVERDFRTQMESFFNKVHNAYLRHRDFPNEEILLFSSHDLATLFAQDYRSNLSLEGFHSVAITLLEALMEESPKEDTMWVIEQISHLHLRIARLLSSATQMETLETDKREWITFHTVDDALREDHDPRKAYRLMLEEFSRMGIRDCDLFLLPESVEFVGARSFALSDLLTPIGTLTQGKIDVPEKPQPIVFQELLSQILARYDHVSECIVGGVIAGNELLGVAAMDSETLSDHGQLMAYLNLGFALKHLQMIATERELNEILNQNNLLLKRQSQHDEMTGLLNRRGFMNHVSQTLGSSIGQSGTILYLDLDGLKFINDTLGHDVGDQAIKATASVLRQCLPEGTILSRLGGDEFVACITTDGQLEQQRVIGAVKRATEHYNDTHSNPFELSISVGSAEFTIDESTSSLIPQIMAEADEHLYKMKRRRKGSRRYQNENGDA